MIAKILVALMLSTSFAYAQKCMCEFKTHYKGVGKFYRLYGWIVQDSTNNPALCTSVKLYDGGRLEYSCCTDTNGFYMIWQVKPDHYTVVYEQGKEKWIRENYWIGFSYEDTILLDKLPRKRDMTPTTSKVYTTFVDSNRNPIVNAITTLYVGTDSISGRTDSLGNLTFTNLPIGKVRVEIQLPSGKTAIVRNIPVNAYRPSVQTYRIYESRLDQEYQPPLYSSDVHSSTKRTDLPKSYWDRVNKIRAAQDEYKKTYYYQIRFAQKAEHERRVKKKKKKKRKKKRKKFWDNVFNR